MKTKKYKTADNRRSYGIEVSCKALSRKLVCGANTLTEGVALAVSHALIKKGGEVPDAKKRTCINIPW